MWLQDCIDQYESHFSFHYGLELSFNELLRVDQAEVGMILFFLWMSPTPRVEPVITAEGSYIPSSSGELAIWSFQFTLYN